MDKRRVGAKGAREENCGGTWECAAGSPTGSSLLFPSAFARTRFGGRAFAQLDLTLSFVGTFII